MFDLEFLIASGTEWIRNQRNRHRSSGSQLSPSVRETLSNYFEPPTLEVARVARVPLIQNPPFFEDLPQIPLDFRQMAGITFGDTILVSDAHAPVPAPPDLLFHELVHVVQYRELGKQQFARRYVEGWASARFVYQANPLEKIAYELHAAFQRNELPEGTVEPRIIEALGTS